MHRANEMRSLFEQLSAVAERTGCAIVIIGHMNKGCGKSQYRGLGSVDIQAAARSVLTVGRVNDDPYLRAFAQGKSNLASEGSAIAFELNPDTGFAWVGKYDITIDELLQGSTAPTKDSVSGNAVQLLKEALLDKPLPATTVLDMAAERRISKRTLYSVKAELGVKSIKRNNQWYWQLQKE